MLNHDQLAMDACNASSGTSSYHGFMTTHEPAMLPDLTPREIRKIPFVERVKFKNEVLDLPLGDTIRREWLVALCTAYPSWDRLAHDSRNTPTLHGMGDPISEALAMEYDVHQTSMGSHRRAS